MKNKKTLIISFLIIIIGIATSYGIFSYLTKQKANQESVNTITENNTEQKDIENSDPYGFDSLTNKKYIEVKKKLIAQGWSISEVLPSAEDKEFPEIGGCGNGIDAICFVNLKKGDIEQPMDVQIGGRPPYGPYLEWTVIGFE
jgi:hypothetical protein